MDSSNHNNGLHNPYMQQFNNPGFDPTQFLNDVQEYTAGSNDVQSQFDPALFDMSADLGSYQQPQQQTDATGYNPSNPQQRTQSPGLSQFKQNSNPYGSHPYSQNIFNSQLSQFDTTLMPRQSQSPNQFSAQRGMNFHQQQPDLRYNPYFQQPQPRQESSQTPTPPPFQQTQNQQGQQQYMNMSMPSSQLQHMQNNHNFSYAYQPGQPATHRFIDPNILNAGQPNYSGMPADLQSHDMSNQSYYAKPAGGSTVDPRSLQHAQFAEPTLQMRNGPIQSDMSMSQGQMMPQMQHPSQQAMQSVLQFSRQTPVAKDPNAPKRPRGRPKKNGQPSGTSSESDDDLEIEDEPPEPKPALLCLEKPADPRGRLLYEVVEAVWAPRNKPALSEKIRSGVAIFGDSVRTLRDMWKSQNEKLKKAELPNSGTAVQTSALKADVAKYRQDMQDLVTRALRYSHPSILRRLGENSFAMSAMYSFLLDRVTSDDYDSSLVVAILQLASHFETMDDEHLEKVKWTKILSTRISKKSTNNSKELALRILANAKAATARKGTEGLAGGPASPSNSSNGRTPVSVAGVKRGRDERETIQQAMAKKATIKPSSKPLSVQIEERRKAREKEKAAAALAAKDSKGDKQSVNGGLASTAARPKVAATAPVKINPFVLQSASKRAGTTNAERAAANAKEKVDALAKGASGTTSTPAVASTTIKNEVPKSGTAAVSKATGSALAAAGFLDFLSSMDKPKEAPAKKVDVDPNETSEEREKRLRKEERRKLRVSWRPDDELVQVKLFEHDLDEETGHDDSMVRDVGNTAKEGEMLKRHLDHHDDDDSDEEEEFEDVYTLPSEVDFEIMDTESREGNFLKTGGSNVASSPASEAQAKHEEGNLMTMFTFRDQPDSPKEPPAEDEDENFDPVVDFGEPSDPLVRRREQQMLTRKQQYQQPTQQTPSNGVDLSRLLAGMPSQHSQLQHQQSQWQNVPNMFGQPNQQVAAAQQPGLGGIDLQKLLSVAGQYSQLQQAQQQQSTYQSSSSVPAAQTSVNPQLAAMLAQLSGQQQPSFAMNGSQLHNGASTSSYTGTIDESYGKKEKKKGKVPLGPDGKPLNYKTQVCSFWKEGKCMKGDACTYRHDE